MLEASSLNRQSIEKLRRNISVSFATLWVAAALFTAPGELGSNAYEAMELSGFALLIAAALGRMWCTVHIGGRKNRELCRRGPYEACRNPLYFFSFLGVVGACLALQNPMLLLFTAPVFLGFYHLVIRAEETRLSAYFGEDYERYRREVPRFWPRWVDPSETGELVISLRHFMRGLGEVVWFLVAIILIDAVEWAHLSRLWPTHVLPW